MVDLRNPVIRAQVQGDPIPGLAPEETAQDAHQIERLTPPAADLLEALEAEFAKYLPDPGPPHRVAEQVAEQRGAWLVINFLRNVREASLNKERN